MPRLFSYTIPIDDGAAPNPFRGMCSLAICKPDIRRVAKVDDWVVGVGSMTAPSGDLSGRVVYTMRVEQVLSLREYDELAEENWPDRVPDIRSKDLTRRLGDCIYDFSKTEPRLRPSVHGPDNIDTDLRGENVLISTDFYYFGRNALTLPNHLLPICHQTQGHKSDANTAYLKAFIEWVRQLGFSSGQHGWPDYVLDWNVVASQPGCSARSAAQRLRVSTHST